MSEIDFSALNEAGLNLQAVLDLDALPLALRNGIDPEHRYRQSILIGHGGRILWEQVQAAGLQSEHPIDDFSCTIVKSWLAAQWPERAFVIAYPGGDAVDLQALGKQAGWHHDSPFRVGINAVWGTWYAYRVLVLADACLVPSPRMAGESPCLACSGRPCITACPGDALAEADFSLQKCVAYRRQPESLCRATCVARTVCPVRPEHRYPDAQITHSYLRSLAMIEQYARAFPDHPATRR